MVKVGDKFIIEVKEQVKPKLFDTGLVPYDRAAIFFFEDTLKQCERYNETEAYTKGYAKAMEDIQNAVRVFRVMNNEDRKRYFDGKYTTTAILDTFDPREIVEKLKAYEKEQSKIKVGDEVKVENSGGYLCKAIVTYVDKYEKEIYVVFAGGSAGEITDGTRLRKTGRHFDEVESLLKILKNMTGGEDSEQIPF